VTAYTPLMGQGNRLLSAVLEPRRRTILQMLAEEERDVAVGELAKRFSVTRPAISQHLAVLKDAGLVDHDTTPGRRGYRLKPEGVAAAKAALDALATELPGGGAGTGERAPVALELDVDGPREAVAQLLTTRAGIERWLGPKAEIDARPGGIFRVDLGVGDIVAGTYLHVDAPSLVVFTWGVEGGDGPLAPGATRVDVALGEAGQGRTRVRLEHRGLPAEFQAPHLAAWARHLAQLDEVTGGR